MNTKLKLMFDTCWMVSWAFESGERRKFRYVFLLLCFVKKNFLFNILLKGKMEFSFLSLYSDGWILLNDVILGIYWMLFHQSNSSYSCNYFYCSHTCSCSHFCVINFQRKKSIFTYISPEKILFFSLVADDECNCDCKREQEEEEKCKLKEMLKCHAFFTFVNEKFIWKIFLVFHFHRVVRVELKVKFSCCVHSTLTRLENSIDFFFFSFNTNK